MRKQDRLSILVVVGALFFMARFGAREVQGQDAVQEQLLEATNADRLTQGLPALKWDAALAQAAEAHAQRMMNESELSHQYPGEPDLVTRAGREGAHFRSVAENVAIGPEPQAIEQEWMHSAPHRANILDPRMNAIGIGLVKRDGSPYYYAVEDFSDAVAQMGPQDIEKKVGVLLQQEGIQPTGPVEDARQTCEMEHGSAGGSAPKFVVRWEGSDLTRLPQMLEQQLQSGRYHTAAVGACDSSQPGQGFTTYHVAVMLY
jgi:Cysteine-rich secretory protein family